MSKRDSQARRLLAREAARLMYEEVVGQYFTAKRMAAKRLLGARGARQLHFRPRDLPSNGEIQEALLALAQSVEGDGRLDRLADMRRCALAVMRQMSLFEPRLIGSVSTGHIRRGSDIDLHLFSEDPDAPEGLLIALGHPYERRDVQIRRGGGWHDYQHLHCEEDYPVEMTVYPPRDLRVRPRSSTDGKPIQRLKISEVEALLDPKPGESAAHGEHVRL